MFIGRFLLRSEINVTEKYLFMPDNEPSDSLPRDANAALQRLQENRGPVPDIDFTIHEMEDGSKVSTLDRYCKG